MFWFARWRVSHSLRPSGGRKGHIFSKKHLELTGEASPFRSWHMPSKKERHTRRLYISETDVARSGAQRSLVFDRVHDEGIFNFKVGVT
jgi:hypothetical protein